MLYFEYCKISRVCRMYWDECRRHECQYPDQTSDISRIQVQHIYHVRMCKLNLSNHKFSGAKPVS